MVKRRMNDVPDQSGDEQNRTQLLLQAFLGLGLLCFGLIMFVVFGLLALFAWGVVLGR